MIRFVRWNSSMSQTRRIIRQDEQDAQYTEHSLAILPFVHFAYGKGKMKNVY